LHNIAAVDNDVGVGPKIGIEPPPSNSATIPLTANNPELHFWTYITYKSALTFGFEETIYIQGDLTVLIWKKVGQNVAIVLFNYYIMFIPTLKKWLFGGWLFYLFFFWLINSSIEAFAVCLLFLSPTILYTTYGMPDKNMA